MEYRVGRLAFPGRPQRRSGPGTSAVTPTLSSPPSPEFARALLAEETRQHARVLGPSLGSTIVAAVLLAIYLHGFMPAGPLLVWLGVLLGAVALRGGLHLLDRKGAAADPHDPRWRRLTPDMLRRGTERH